ncbi:MAG: hypothetical protein U0U67_08540 [Chitinophagales bacterium]
MSDDNFTIKMNISKPLEDLLNDFSVIFKTAFLEYDFENEAAWIHGVSDEHKYINISREHDGDSRSSKKPLNINLYFYNYKDDRIENYKKLAEIISKHFDIVVYFGKNILNNKTEHEFVVLGNINPKIKTPSNKSL